MPTPAFTACARKGALVPLRAHPVRVGVGKRARRRRPSGERSGSGEGDSHAKAAINARAISTTLRTTDPGPTGRVDSAPKHAHGGRRPCTNRATSNTVNTTSSAAAASATTVRYTPPTSSAPSATSSHGTTGTANAGAPSACACATQRGPAASLAAPDSTRIAPSTMAAATAIRQPPSVSRPPSDAVEAAELSPEEQHRPVVGLDLELPHPAHHEVVVAGLHHLVDVAV